MTLLHVLAGRHAADGRLLRQAGGAAGAGHDQPRSRTSWLAVFAVLMSLVGAFYYLRVVKVMYFDEPAPAGAPIGAAGSGVSALLASTARAVLVFGLLPGGLMAMCRDAIVKALHQLSDRCRPGAARCDGARCRRRHAQLLETFVSGAAGVQGRAARRAARHRRAARRRAGHARVHGAPGRGGGGADPRRRPPGAGAPVPLSGGPRDAGVPGRQDRRRRGAAGAARSASWPRKPATGRASGPLAGVAAQRDRPIPTEGIEILFARGLRPAACAGRRRVHRSRADDRGRARCGRGERRR